MNLSAGPKIELSEAVGDCLSDAAFQKISDMIGGKSGIQLPDSKRSLVQARIGKRLRVLKLDTFDDYVRYLTTKAGRKERESLLTALTTNVTRFYREQHHFKDLRDNVFPALIERAKTGSRIRIWSAGCSTGQEPYSIALTALGVDPNVSKYDFKILATDIDRSVLAQGRSALYPKGEVTQIPDDIRLRHIKPVKGSRNVIQVSEDARRLISFKELNLIKEWPIRGPFDIIFCRNVVIYFDAATSQKIWTGFAKVLKTDGRLYVGHSERLKGEVMEYLQPSGITSYRKKSEAELENVYKTET